MKKKTESDSLRFLKEKKQFYVGLPFTPEVFTLC